MLPPHAIYDHAPLIAVLAEHLQSEADALLTAEGDSERLLHAGGILTLSRVAHDEAERLVVALLAPSPVGELATLDASDEG